MIKLIIQIPCFNEEETLGLTLAALPRELPGIDTIEWLVIDDGSIDRTIDVAKKHGVDHIIPHHKNLGLAKAFMNGINACLKLGADVIVNTDADNQYCADDIPKLISPILKEKAEIVIGARPIDQIKDFSVLKKFLQKLGSWTVRLASNTDIQDATSGFRAISRKAARKINIFDNYTYTLETIIQAGQKDIPITWVPVRTNENLRPSRLMNNVPAYIRKSIFTILRVFAVYKPFRFFISIGAVLFTAGSLIAGRFLWFYSIGQGGGKIQSLILASILIGLGFQAAIVAFIADLLSVNRRLLEDLQSRLKRHKADDD
ncbi:MAG: glycosyltransferase family 2 protein [Candidatus Omnitrophica bacterium]|nr:glycosyltransferase family 2 protein [Candidatus Omnitrophota bacterium]